MATDKLKQYYTSLVQKTLLTAQMSLQVSTLTDSQVHDLIKANERYLAECQRTEPSLIPVEVKEVQPVQPVNLNPVQLDNVQPVQ